MEDLDALRPAAEQYEATKKRFIERMSAPLIRALREGAGTIYKVLSSDNVLYMALPDPDTGGINVVGYGDAKPGEFHSAVTLLYRAVLPNSPGVKGIPMAINMSFDGFLIVVTNDGRVFALTRELQLVDRLILPEARQSAGKSQNWMAGLVRNGISIDPDGGVYAVSRTHFHRIVWNGERFFLDEKDGAWSESYYSGVNGSGTTPTPIGWGQEQDQLLVTLDGDKTVMAYWRNRIPEDWAGIDGQPRRVAGMAEFDFGAGTPDVIHMEASPVASGYGFFWQNDTPRAYPDEYSNPVEQIFAKYSSVGFRDHHERGGVKYIWNTETRELQQAWVTDTQFAPNVCTPNSNGILYCVGMRGADYSIEALDWTSGEIRFHRMLGDSIRFNPMAAVVRIAPNGSIDASSLGAAILRISPEELIPE